MDKAYKYAKSAIAHFKLDTCCCFAPIRIGLLIVGYFNLFIAVLSLIGTADGGITPPLMEVQDSLLEEEQVSAPLGVVAYACELAFSAVLLCAMYRNDIVLLRVYIYFLMATVVTSVLMYSMVIAKVSLLTKIIIISNIVFNCYVIILVRSAIVEIKERQSLDKNGHVVLYSVATVSHEDDKKVKVIEILPIANTSEHEKGVKIGVIDEAPKKDDKIVEQSEKNDKTGAESKRDDKVGEESKTSEKVDETQAKLETVNECPKEEQSVH
ncbi:uncharacterized protein LOC123873336 [Maniola jurtina]|uniref:uncharacterized protein LOC123873336 n=1 Tax=Maniola jurtina TaxID=191418 RepID=UPI001E68FCA1|nr:uncharacterized protein LOC123873336 [Maniola jurtina]